MQILRTVGELRRWSRALRAEGGNTLGLVPTMGALHAGHASLIRAARAASTHVAVSLFVNPTQFGPNEDYARYPRALRGRLRTGCRGRRRRSFRARSRRALSQRPQFNIC